MDDQVSWRRAAQVDRTASALRAKGFSVEVATDAATARGMILHMADGAQTIGFGGSMTLASLDLAKALRDEGKETLIHGRAGLSADEKISIMRRQLTCDLFLSSVNAITEKGHLVNVDGNGNRNAALTFGPKKVVVVAGWNKIVPDLDRALIRIQEEAAPPNARRLGMATPCAATGECTNCNSPERICRITTIIERKPRPADFTVILVQGDLGY